MLTTFPGVPRATLLNPTNHTTPRCWRCLKYLSVPPIFICTELNGTNINVCGRCEVPKDGRSVRNEAFERLAAYFEFPCSISERCSKRLQWGKVVRHEIICNYRRVLCSMCGPSGTLYYVDDIKYHFTTRHKTQYSLNKTLVIKEQTIFGSKHPRLTYLIEFRTILYLVHIRVVKENDLKVKVEPTLRIPHSFNISFKKNDKVFCLKNRPIRDGYEWIEHDFIIDPIEILLDLNISTPGDTTISPLQLEIEICDEA